MKLSVLLLLLLLTAVATAKTELAPLFAESMVLQQKERVTIWGRDRPEQKIQVSGSWGEEARTTADADGKWSLKLKTPSAGGPFELVVEGSDTVRLRDVLIGEVWLCSGQSNMQMPVGGWLDQPVNGSDAAIQAAVEDRIRAYTVQNNSSPVPVDSVVGRWIPSNPATVGNFSAVAYFFAKQLQNELDVPIGIIVTCWGASSAEAWTDPATLEGLGVEADWFEGEPVQRQPSQLYNAMIHPLEGYTIKGAIWYQGEANRNRPHGYADLITAMVRAWRERWGQGDFPFYYVQIAPFKYWDDANSAFLREAQLQTTDTLGHSGMAVTLDIGEADKIHPAEKRMVGQRLSYWALSETYGVPGIETSGSVYESMELLADGKARLTFNPAAGELASPGKELSSFEIAGADRVFHPAQARIESERQLIVWSDAVPEPVAVRYAFTNTPEASLYSVGGLPASSFRTDDWED